MRKNDSIKEKRPNNMSPAGPSGSPQPQPLILPQSSRTRASRGRGRARERRDQESVASCGLPAGRSPQLRRTGVPASSCSDGAGFGGGQGFWSRPQRRRRADWRWPRGGWSQPLPAARSRATEYPSCRVSPRPSRGRVERAGAAGGGRLERSYGLRASSEAAMEGGGAAGQLPKVQ